MERADVANRTCKGCPTTFEVAPREWNPRVWCSEACRVWCHHHPGVQRPVVRACAHCAADISSRRMAVLFCSKRCCDQASHARRPPTFPRPALCVWCANLYEQRREVHRTCSLPCGRALYRFENPDKYPSWDEAKKAASQRRRARKRAVPTEHIVAAVIYARDGGVCQLCNGDVDLALAWPHPLSASLDHRIPLSKGGSHTAANIQLAHLSCNTRKRDRPMPHGVGPD